MGTVQATHPTGEPGNLTMRVSRHVSIQVEGFESRTLLSTAAAAPAEVVPQIYPPPVLLNGGVRGGVLIRHGIPDAGDMYVFRGSGRVGPRGPVSAQGVIQSTSLTGDPIGSLTLSNRFGRVELRLDIRSQISSGGLPNAVSFVVARATGQFARFQGTDGVIELHTGKPGRGGVAAFEMMINPVMIQAR